MKASESSLEQLRSLIQTPPTSPGSRTVLEIPLDEIEVDHEQPRSAFQRPPVRAESKRSLESLAANLRAVGIEQPLLVRPRSDATGYWLVAGERRWRAARIAGLETVPCILSPEDLDDPVRRLLAQLSENLQREDLPLLDTAVCLRRLTEDLAIPAKELARQLGRSPSWVSQHLAVLKVDEISRQAVDRGVIRSVETLRLFDKLPATRKRRLVATAESTETPIGRGSVVTAPRRREPSKLRAGQRPKKRKGHTEVFDLRLTAVEIVTLINRLGGRPPEEPRELVPVLLQLLRGKRARRASAADRGQAR